MGISEKIKILMIKRGKKAKDIADLLGIEPGSLSRKLKGDSFTPEELGKIAASMGATYAESPPPRQWFTLNDTGEEI